MGLDHQTARAAQPWRILLTLVCALLVVIGCTAQVAHTHTDGAVNHADCSLCVAAHAGVQVSETPATVPVAAVVVAAVEPPFATAPHSAVSAFALFTRPPPAYVFPA